MKILWVTNIPSPYRVNYFNELGNYCELTVLFEREDSSERDSSWKKFHFKNFEGIILKGVNFGVDKSLNLKIIKFLKKGYYSHVVISNPFTPTGILAIKYLKVRRIPYSIVSDGGIPRPEINIKKYFKRNILKGADLYFSTAAIHDEYYTGYGVDKDKVVRYPFSSLTNDDILKSPLDSIEKENYKRKLKIKEDQVIIMVGRFAYEKGQDVLLKAVSNLEGNIGVYCIGGSPTEELLELKRSYKLKNVHFVEFKLKKELTAYYKAADLFVLPTRGDVWGLVINEAMAKGLPVITTEKCVAGLELIENNINGFIVSIDNSSELTMKIKEILNNKMLSQDMAYNNIEKIKEYTIEKMVENNLFNIKKILKN